MTAGQRRDAFKILDSMVCLVDVHPGALSSAGGSDVNLSRLYPAIMEAVTD